MVARPGTPGSNETVWKRRRQTSRFEDATSGRRGAPRPPNRGSHPESRAQPLQPRCQPPSGRGAMRLRTAVLLVRCGFDDYVRLLGLRLQGRAVLADFNIQSAKTATQQLGPPAKAFKSVKVAHRQRAEANTPLSAAQQASLPRRRVLEKLRLGPKVYKLSTGNAWPLAISREFTDSLTYGPSSSPVKDKT